jgi:hypothetical protein
MLEARRTSVFGAHRWRALSFLFASSIAAVVVLTTAPSAAWAAKPLEDLGDDASSGGHGPFGVGIVIGEPTGFTMELMLGRTSAVQAHLGYGVGRRGRFVLNVDYLFHFMDAIGPIGRAGHLAPYVGVGGHLGVREHENDPVLGVRIPVGLAFFIRSAPVAVFAEVALGVGVVPSTELIADGGIGGRFFF